MPRWFERSGRRGKADEVPGGAEGGEESRVVIHLDRFPLADQRLSTTSGADLEATLPEYPWRQLRITGDRQGREYRLRLTMVDGGSG